MELEDKFAPYQKEIWKLTEKKPGFALKKNLWYSLYFIRDYCRHQFYVKIMHLFITLLHSVWWIEITNFLTTKKQQQHINAANYWVKL